MEIGGPMVLFKSILFVLQPLVYGLQIPMCSLMAGDFFILNADAHFVVHTFLS